MGAIAKQQHHSAAPLATLDEQTMMSLVAGGDCARLTPTQKLAYYQARCEAAGLDPRAQPFEFVNLGGKLVLYARKAATDGLASKHGVVTTIVSQTTENDVRIVTVRATARDGRQTEDIGVVTLANLKGEALANALMKCVTKAKRRAILSLCGLGMMDETEVETVPSAAQRTAQAPTVVDSQFQEVGVLSPGVDPPAMSAPTPTTPVIRGAVPHLQPALVAERVRKAWERLKEEKGDEDALPLWKETATQLGLGKSSSWTAEDVDRVVALLWPVQESVTP